MDMQITKTNSSQIQTTSVSTDAMRRYIMSAAQNLNDEKLLRLLYIRAINLEAKDK